MCEETGRWIETLVQGLETWVDALLDEPLCTSVWIPVFHSGLEERGERYRLFCLPATLRRAAREIRIGEKTYCLLRPDGGDFDLPLDFRAPYFAIEIDSRGPPLGEDSPWGRIPQEGDLVLVRGQCLSTSQALDGEELSGDFQGGRFTRDEDGRVRFVIERAQIIGKEDNGRQFTGEVVAILRPSRG